MNKINNIDEQEHDLLCRLKSREPGAFKEIVELYQDRVLNTCYRFIFNREDAEDIAQEVFCEIHRSIATFREESKLSTWIYRIAVTKSIDYIRKTKRKKRMARLKTFSIMDERAKDAPAPLDNDPARGLEKQERMRILQEAIDTLPESQHIVFTLSKSRGIGSKEIADIMGTTLSAVESLMHRAKQNLRKKLSQYFEKDFKKKGKSPQVFYFFDVSTSRNCLVFEIICIIINNE